VGFGLGLVNYGLGLDTYSLGLGLGGSGLDSITELNYHMSTAIAS